jgi:type I restriction enzyme S subunit
MLSEVPEGWCPIKLGDITDIKTGGTPSRKEDSFWGGDIHWMSSGEVWKKRVLDTEEKITEAALSGSAAKILPKGSVMIALNGQGKTRGAAAILERDMTCNQSLAAVVPSTKHNNYFMLYFIESQYQNLRNITGDNARNGLNLGLLKSYELVLPPLNEQHRIAEILSSVDVSIQATQAVIEQAERVKRGLMEELLTGGLGSEAIERGEVPEGWHMCQLKELCEIAGEYGANASKEEFNPSLPRYLRITDIKEDGTLDDDVKVSLSIEKSAGYELEHGDVLIARSGATVGKSYVYEEADGWCVFAGYLLRFRLNRNLASYRWLRHVLRTSWYWDWVRDNQRAGAQPNINAKEYGAMFLLVPPLEIQLGIAEQLDSLSALVKVNRDAIAQYQRLKRGLMDDLLTGKVRTV